MNRIVLYAFCLLFVPAFAVAAKPLVITHITIIDATGGRPVV